MKPWHVILIVSIVAIIIISDAIVNSFTYTDTLPEIKPGLENTLSINDKEKQVESIIIIPNEAISSFNVFVNDIPDYSHVFVTEKTVDDALNSWMNLNPNLEFKMVQDSQDADIVIFWVNAIPFGSHSMGITKSDIIQDYYGQIISQNHKITIDLVDADCNGEPIFWDKDTVIDVIKHEIGHTLGLNHSSIENHLMFDPDDGVVGLNTLGYSIPKKSTIENHIGEREIQNESERLNKKYVDSLTKYGWSVDDWEKGERRSTSGAFYDEINSIIDELNPVIEEYNCYVESTNLYYPYS
jgi:hypothetical protein